MRTPWRLAVSPVTFVVICLLWCLNLGLGSLLAHRRQDLFGAMDAYPFALWLREVGARILPWSAWVYLLAGLTWCMVASLALCTVNWFWRRRRRLRGAGEVLVHLGFLLVFSGFVVGATLGERVHGVTVAVTGHSRWRRSAPVRAKPCAPRSTTTTSPPASPIASTWSCSVCARAVPSTSRTRRSSVACRSHPTPRAS